MVYNFIFLIFQFLVWEKRDRHRILVLERESCWLTSFWPLKILIWYSRVPFEERNFTWVLFHLKMAQEYRSKLKSFQVLGWFFVLDWFFGCLKAQRGLCKSLGSFRHFKKWFNIEFLRLKNPCPNFSVLATGCVGQQK